MNSASLTLRPSSRAWQRFRRSPASWIGGMLMIGFLAAAATADWISPYSVNDQGPQLAKPSRQHWLGTDINRHDTLSRVIFGTRLSMVSGLISILLAIGVGVPVGTVAGYFSGRIDSLLMRMVDVALTFPSILIAILVSVALARGWLAVIISVGLINVPVFARQVRATVLAMRSADYVLASESLGASALHVFARVIFPAIVSPVVVLATLGLGSAILEVAGLSFIGVGGDPTAPEWGSMLAAAKSTVHVSVWPALGPGAAISLSIIGFNLLGDGLRDALDPNLVR